MTEQGYPRCFRNDSGDAVRAPVLDSARVLRRFRAGRCLACRTPLALDALDTPEGPLCGACACRLLVDPFMALPAAAVPRGWAADEAADLAAGETWSAESAAVA